MSKPKGIIVIELPEVPEDCYHCNQIDGTAGYCEHVGRFVDHFVKPGERYPTCPIRPMPQPRSECSWEEYDAGWDDCLLAFLGELPEPYKAGCEHGYGIEHTQNVLEQERLKVLRWVGKISDEELYKKWDELKGGAE